MSAVQASGTILNELVALAAIIGHAICPKWSDYGDNLSTFGLLTV